MSRRSPPDPEGKKKASLMYRKGYKVHYSRKIPKFVYGIMIFKLAGEPIPSPVPAELKRNAEDLIKRYFIQLTEGCGRADCNNENCYSFSKNHVSTNEAAAMALQLLLKRAKLCDLKIDIQHDHDNVVNVAAAADPFLSRGFIESLISACKASGDFKPLVRVLGKAFSSPDILNKSFLVHDAVSGEPESVLPINHVDIIASYNLLFGLGQGAVENSIINGITALGNSIEIELKTNHRLLQKEDLTQFIIVLLNPNLHSPAYLESALPNMLRAMMALSLELKCVLVQYWSKHPEVELRKLVDIFQQMITVRILTGPHAKTSMPVNDDPPITNSVKALELVYFASILGGEFDDQKSCPELTDQDTEMGSVESNVLISAAKALLSDVEPPAKSKIAENLKVDVLNCRKPVIPFKDFVNDCLNDAIEMDRDFMYYKDGGIRFSFLNYPFVLSTVTKSLGLFYDNRVRMYSERRMMVLYALMQGHSQSPYLKIKVRRSHLIQDALICLEMVAQDRPVDFKKQFFVEFEGEQGVDEGGPSKEFFQLVIEELFNPDFGMFQVSEETRQCWFIPTSFENEKEFTLIGLLFGIAIYNNIILDVNFPAVLYSKLLGKKGTFLDLESSHPGVYRGLKHLLLYDGNVAEDIMTTFEISYTDVFGSTVNHELIKNGKSVLVTNENRQEYVDRYTDFLLNQSVKVQFEAFKAGFDIVISDSILKSLIRADELELLVCGSQSFDFKELERATDYDGGYASDTPVIRYFWDVVHHMSPDQQRQLLNFTTGSDRVPVGGLSKLRLIIAKNGPDCDRLPTAHTCFNVLLLPEYTSLEKTRDRLMKAISYAKGFGLM